VLRSAIMGTLFAIVGYLVVSPLMLFGLTEGARWIAKPDPTLTVAAPRPPSVIPPRIAESIERKKPFVPDPRPSEDAKPVMIESYVSLPKDTPKVRIREVAVPKTSRPRKRSGPRPSVNEYAPQSTAAVRGRSDNPYD
jgi:hypothetical protein